MIQLKGAFHQSLKKLNDCQACKSALRHISALYITGDKASENYVTIQPYMDFEGTFRQQQQLEQSIALRKMSTDLKSVLSLYEKYKQTDLKLQQLEEQRDTIVKQLKQLGKQKATAQQTEKALKEQGKALREKWKNLKHSFYPIEDEFVHAFLNLPALLHEQCAQDEKLLYLNRVNATTKQVHCHMQRTDLIDFIDNSCYYLLQEAAEFDINASLALTRYLVQNANFMQIANPDFVRCVLLEANATPITESYHMVLEEQLQNKLNAAYLTGGASFESYLGALTKLCVYPSVLPLRFVCSGRSYQKIPTSNQPEKANLFTATQSNAVSTLVATETAAQADEQLEQILNLAVDFYKALDVNFRIVYAKASSLLPAECLRADIEVYAPAQQRYMRVGHIANYGDFVSKRILFSMRQQKNYHFPHLIGGPILLTTRLIAALLEHGISLQQCKLLGCYQQEQATANDAITNFKNIFQ